MDSESKRYNIDTFDKLCNVVNKENATRLAIDLAQWLIHYALTIDNIREKLPKETKKKTNTKIAKGYFIWVDDGKNDLFGATVEDTRTGEITKIDFPNNEQKA